MEGFTRVAGAGLAVMALFLGACAAPTTRPANLDPAAVALEAKKQQEIALQDYVKHVSRLQRVGFPILQAAVPLCADKVNWSVGALFANKDDFRKEWQEAAAGLYKVDGSLRVFHLVDGGPAAAAGLQIGDEVVSFVSDQ